MKLINPYSPTSQLKNFPDIDERIRNYYDILEHTVLNQDQFRNITPRYKLEHGLKIGFRDIFYYIDQLYDNKPNSIIDVGCGECIWKNWFPNIVGFDPAPSFFSMADFTDYFDTDFVNNHYENYDCGMALNSIHFVPWEKIIDQIKLSMQLIKNKGRFLFTINFNMLDECSAESSISKLSIDDKFNLFYELLDKLQYKKIVVDSPYHRGISMADINEWGYINGTVRFILEK